MNLLKNIIRHFYGRSRPGSPMEAFAIGKTSLTASKTHQPPSSECWKAATSGKHSCASHVERRPFSTRFLEKSRVRFLSLFNSTPSERRGSAWFFGVAKVGPFGQ